MSFSQYFEHDRREAEIYRRWEESGAFRANGESARPHFSISMPPPNATGTLHLGHAIGMTIEDILIRFRRMVGDEALWLPGTDHAAIATESVVIKSLQKEGMADPRGELGRDELVRRIADYVHVSRATIRSQIRALGASCDWSRERYTMDPQLNRCVNEVFGRMFRDGLIYRGSRIVNWDTGLQTTVSDDEIEHREQAAKFYTLRYGPFLVGTSRPETKLGDTAIAVHPDDERYQSYVGQTIEVPWPKGPTIQVRVVADRRVDPEFGTGALGVTPAHSAIDFEIAREHNLPMIQIIGEDGRMTEAAGIYAGQTVAECREAFARDLDAAGLLEKVETYPQKLSVSYRSKQPIEPLLKLQWFIDVEKPAVRWRGKFLSLKQVMRDVVATGEVQILPRHEEKTYFHWIDNLRDWCISRQIWWGHRVPVWYRGAQEMYVGHRGPTGAAGAAGSENQGWEQDSDTLDTWFSSALWTWSTLVDPLLAEDKALDLGELLARSPDYSRFHPTSVMETGYDILFFWVARMVLMTTYVTGTVPFRTVYLHGLVLDRDGDKMSKSKPETAIDPLDTIREHGADALRMSLVIGNAPGQDFRLSQERILACKHLVNKLWNAAKLVERTLGEAPVAALERGAVCHPVNRWMVARVDALIEEATQRLEVYAFGDVAESLRSGFWTEFCDFYLEAVKVPELTSLEETRCVVLASFTSYLRLLHPYLPFVTEEIWGELGQTGQLIATPWPQAEQARSWPTLREDVEGVDAILRLVTAIRRIRVEAKADVKAQVDARVFPAVVPAVFAACAPVVRKLAGVQSLRFVAATEVASEGATVAVDAAFRVAVDLGAANLEAEKARLSKQLEESEKRLASTEKLLANPNFVDKAKPEAVASARGELEKLQGTVAALRERLATLG
jgi:valyl-tRNA synthetase